MDASLECLSLGHIPVNFDPTGGDPFIGGPVMLTKCDRCGKELEKSDAARLFNQYTGLLRDNEAEYKRRLTGYVEDRDAALNQRNYWRAWALMLLVFLLASWVGWTYAGVIL